MQNLTPRVHFNEGERVFILRPGKKVEEAVVAFSDGRQMVLNDLSKRTIGVFAPTPEQGRGVLVIHAGERTAAEWLAGEITKDAGGEA